MGIRTELKRRVLLTGLRRGEMCSQARPGMLRSALDLMRIPAYPTNVIPSITLHIGDTTDHTGAVGCRPKAGLHSSVTLSSPTPLQTQSCLKSCRRAIFIIIPMRRIGHQARKRRRMFRFGHLSSSIASTGSAALGMSTTLVGSTRASGELHGRHMRRIPFKSLLLPSVSPTSGLHPTMSFFSDLPTRQPCSVTGLYFSSHVVPRNISEVHTALRTSRLMFGYRAGYPQGERPVVRVHGTHAVQQLSAQQLQQASS